MIMSTFAFQFRNLSTTEIFVYLIGGGILAIVIIGLIAIIARRGKNPPGDV